MPPAARPTDRAVHRYINKIPRRNKFAVLTAFNNNSPVLCSLLREQRPGRGERAPRPANAAPRRVTVTKYHRSYREQPRVPARVEIFWRGYRARRVLPAHPRPDFVGTAAKLKFDVGATGTECRARAFDFHRAGLKSSGCIDSFFFFFR